MQRRVSCLIVCFALSACAKRAAEGAVADVAPPVSQETPLRYPSGAWWGGAMSKLYLSAAHILVSHRGAEPWSSLPGVARSERSRDEALTKARALQAELERDPTRFEALAASSSDDMSSARFGGVLGTFRAARVPPEFVDAIGHLQPHQISHVVETSAGFHLIRRLAPPPNVARSFAHIVIKYAGTTGWRRSDRALPKRSREEAQAIAEHVAQEAKRGPEHFAELVQQYSDADDVIRGGDLGALTPYDGYAADFSVFTRMSRLDTGEVSEVLESPGGFEVVQRTAAETRELRAASVITLLYAGAQSNDAAPSTRAKAKAEKTAGALLRELRASPRLFGERRTEYCELYRCEEPVRFRRGRELSALDVTVGQLRVGELASVDSPIGLLIVRREDPASIAVDEAAPLTDFPMQPLAAPTQPSAPPASAAELVVRLGGEAARALALKGEQADAFAAIFEQLKSRIQAQPEGDFADEDAAWADARVLALLGEDKNEEYVRFRRSFLARLQ